jgi:dolichyl-diphosphooligosaccharide--protein glycosyltransferase
VTKFMAEEGWHAFLNFFDLRSWYPLGRATGPTLYPGLMITSSLIYWALGAINVPINIRLVMHFLPPLFTGFTSIACFLLGRAAMLGPQSSAEEKAESERRRVKADAVGLLAAAFAAIVPGYAQRSVAGAYDNEAIAIFALVLTFYLWVKAVNTGSLAVAVGSALAYFYMVSAWGGYIFILNLIPMHVLALMIAGRYSARLYIAYSTFYVVGTLLSMQIPFVGFQPVYSSEHLPALGVFGLVQLAALNAWLRAFFASDGEYARVRSSLLSAAAALFCLAAVVGSVTGYIAPWTGRLWSLLDPTYAKNNIPIIASVAEHQPTSWSSYFSDFHILSVLMPAGFYFLLQRPTDGGIFLVVYGIVGAYFSGVMIRLILTLAPAMCVLGAVAVQEILEGHVPAAAAYVRSLLAVVVPALAAKSAAPAVADASSTSASSGGGAGPAGAAPLASPTGKKTGARAAAAQATRVSRAQRGLFATVATAAVAALLALYVKHSVWFISEGYSSPSIVMIARTHTGDRKVFDDYREAYSWCVCARVCACSWAVVGGVAGVCLSC